MSAILDFIDKLETTLREKIIAAMEEGRLSIDLEGLKRLVDANDTPAIMSALEQAQQPMEAVETSIGEAFFAAALLAATAINFALRRNDPTLIATQKNHLATLSLKAMPDVAIIAAIIDRFPDIETTAKAIRRTVGLTDKQARQQLALESLLNSMRDDEEPQTFRLGLVEPSGRTETTTRLPGRAFESAMTKHGRKLSASQRSQIRKASERGLTNEEIDELAEQSATAMRRARARAIAATEAMKTTNAGQQAAWERALALGTLPASTRRFWHDAADERVRQNHRAVSSMNPKGVAIGEPFDTPLGPIMFPPMEVNCRCRVSLTKQAQQGGEQTRVIA